MGQPVVHFEVIGADGEKLQKYYSELFGWDINADNDMKYGMVSRDGNLAPDGARDRRRGRRRTAGYGGHVTFYVAVPDVEAALPKAESLGGTRIMGPEKIMDMVELGQFSDPEGHVIGVVNGSM